MALGEIIEESSGKLTGERVLEVEKVLTNMQLLKSSHLLILQYLGDDR